MVNSVAGALMVGKYPTTSFDIGTWSLVLILNPVQLGIV